MEKKEINVNIKIPDNPIHDYCVDLIANTTGLLIDNIKIILMLASGNRHIFKENLDYRKEKMILKFIKHQETFLLTYCIKIDWDSVRSIIENNQGTFDYNDILYLISIGIKFISTIKIPKILAYIAANADEVNSRILFEAESKQLLGEKSTSHLHNNDLPYIWFESDKSMDIDIFVDQLEIENKYKSKVETKIRNTSAENKPHHPMASYISGHTLINYNNRYYLGRSTERKTSYNCEYYHPLLESYCGKWARYATDMGYRCSLHIRSPVYVDFPHEYYNPGSKMIEYKSRLYKYAFVVDMLMMIIFHINTRVASDKFTDINAGKDDKSAEIIKAYFNYYRFTGLVIRNDSIIRTLFEYSLTGVGKENKLTVLDKKYFADTEDPKYKYCHIFRRSNYAISREEIGGMLWRPYFKSPYNSKWLSIEYVDNK